MISRHANERLQIVFMPTSACNADCRYCFSDAKVRQLSLEEVGTIGVRVAEYVSKERIGTVSYFWQGGEVMTLSAKWVEQAFDALARPLDNVGVQSQHRIQSNLLAVDDSWVRLLKERFGARVSTSWDFPSGNRTVAGDPARYEEVWRRKYQEVRNAGLRCGLIAIPTVETIALGPEAFCEHYFDDLDVSGVQVNLPFPSAAWDRAGRGVVLPDLEAFQEFLGALYDLWKQRYAAQGKDLQPFRALEEHIEGRGSIQAPHGGARLPCTWSRNCATHFCSIGPDGTVGLCDCWVLAYPQECYGSILEESLADLLASNRRGEFLKRPEQLLCGECGECEFLGFCFGGCPVRARGMSGEMGQKDGYCSLYKSLFAHVAGQMSAQLEES
jgi:uncharacterized protein